MQVAQPTHSSACKEADRARVQKAGGYFYKYRLKKELLTVLAEGFSRWRESKSLQAAAEIKEPSCKAANIPDLRTSDADAKGIQTFGFRIRTEDAPAASSSPD